MSSQDALFKSFLEEDRLIKLIAKQKGVHIKEVIETASIELNVDPRLGGTGTTNKEFTIRKIGLSQGEKIYPDIISKCELQDRKKILIHLEVQNKKDKTMNLRMNDYLNGLLRKYPGYTNILQIVLNTGVAKLDEHETHTLTIRREIVNFRDIDLGEALDYLDGNKSVAIAFYCASDDKMMTLADKFLKDLYAMHDEDKSNSYTFFYILLSTLHSDGRKISSKCYGYIESNFLGDNK